MKNRFLSGFLLLSLIVSLLAFPVNVKADNFTDSGSIEYREAVDVVYALGILGGYSDGSFRPTGLLTRGAATKIICCMMLTPSVANQMSNYTTTHFRDVPAGHTFAGYISWCVQQGLISGYADGTFHPADPLTSQAFLKMLVCALGYDQEIEHYTGSGWSNNVITRALTIGLNNGLNSTLNGASQVNRERAALFVLNTLQADLVEYTAPRNDRSVRTTTASRGANIKNEGSPYTLQFAEQYFSDLKRSKSTSNGVTTTTWTLQKGNSVFNGTYSSNGSLINSSGGGSSSSGSGSSSNGGSSSGSGSSSGVNYVIRFDANGGSVDVNTRVITQAGTTYGSLPRPTRSGYDFQGWFTAEGSEVTNSTVVTKSQTLYARWTLPITIIFDANGGYVNISSKTVSQGSPYGDLPVPSREGYTFEGWYTSRSNGSPVTPSTTVTGGQTLYAHWSTPSLGVNVLSYRFKNQATDFTYPAGYVIPLARYKLIYGNTALAQQRYVDDARIGWKGNCYGMVATSAMFFQNGNGVSVSSFNRGASVPSDLSVNDRSADFDLTVVDFIEAMQISQRSLTFSRAKKQHLDDFASLCNEVSSSQEKGSNLVIVCIYGVSQGKNAGHALLAYRLDDVSSTQSRIYVYDCNDPYNGERYITITKNGSGRYTGWLYQLTDTITWGSDYTNGHISYIPYEDYWSDWSNKGNVEVGMNYLMLNTSDATILDVEQNVVAVFHDGEAVYSRDDIYPATEVGITADGKVYGNSSISVWVPSNALYKVKNDSHSQDEYKAELVNVEQCVSISTTAQSVTLAAEDATKFGRAEIDEAGCDYTIAFSPETDAGQSNGVIWSGTTTSENTLTLDSRGGQVTLSGTEGTVSLTVNGEQISRSVTKSGFANFSLGG